MVSLLIMLYALQNMLPQKEASQNYGKDGKFLIPLGQLSSVEISNLEFHCHHPS